VIISKAHLIQKMQQDIPISPLVQRLHTKRGLQYKRSFFFIFYFLMFSPQDTAQAKPNPFH